MARSPFSMYTRKGTDGKILYCVRFYEDGGKPIKSVTLWKASSPMGTAQLVERTLNNYVVSRGSNSMALEYFSRFWKRDFDNDQGRVLRVIVLSQRHLDENFYIINRHLAEHTRGNRHLKLLTRFQERTFITLPKGKMRPSRRYIAIQTPNAL
jgi:hypothetical protein